jgi:type I restriction enzyme, S subunit
MPSNAVASVTTFRFDQMATLINDRVDNPAESGVERYVGLEHLDADSLRIRRWGEITDVESTKLRFQPGDIIFGKRRVYQRKLAVADFEGICSAHAMVLRAKASVVLPEFLPFFMQSDRFMERALAISVGSLSPTINWTTLAAEEFALPPIEEQRRLARALTSADHVVECLLDVIGCLRITQAAVFSELVSRAGATPCKLGDLLLQSPRNGCSAPPASVITGHWVLALSAISRWGYRHGEFKPVHRTQAMESAVIARGDLVLSRSNTRELVGLPAVFPEDRTDVSYPDTMMRLVADSSRVDIRYLELCLRAPGCRRQIQSFAAGTSASMKKINASNLRKVSVPLIPPAQQEVVLKEADRIARLIGETETRLAEARSLRTALLETAFGATP